MGINDEAVKAFFTRLDRTFFLEDHQHLASHDRPLPIGYDQTISQPTLVLEMTLSLDLQPDLKVLEVGTGSGYQTALLAEFSEAVYTVERINPLLKKAQKRLLELGYHNIHFKLADGTSGWKEYSPYDRIMVTAAVKEIPAELLRQLSPGGKMIIPVGDENIQELRLIEKKENEEIKSQVIKHVQFVRLRGEYE
ncbi:protein-L-isoaspartate(D-aspartate) O-methyltransferase [Salipaludibacillus aurantiacus]|uniref:Protein-L-isoaspartate O-methyltransferase n=1 Tax=Salipaludibacillus aurantiacus TaxID=1601833 RepID=A0A1H9XAX8_9BACI|nr:protein-L-isoaspartate(D-aspartate) O-methyltransferase [Salipaludibacillus aurantiacus]SES43047.1 protein-L-isoaspartate(D-aspartate) O-methyltransferase [Salipaludibacillus aurantiacus]